MTKEQILETLNNSIYFEESGKCWATLGERSVCPYCHKDISESCTCEGWTQLQKDCAEARKLNEAYAQKLKQIRANATSSVLPYFKKWYQESVYAAELASINSDLKIVESL